VSNMDDAEDGAVAPVARRTGGTVDNAADHLDSATVVTDPGLEPEVRDALVRAGGNLVPYQGPVPPPTMPVGGARGCGFLAGVCLVLAVMGAASGSPALASTMLMFAGTGLLISLLGRPGAGEIAAAHAPVSQHRRYVLPSSDIDNEHWSLWKRAVDARNRIAEATVVSSGQIDSVQVTEVLPQRLWDIAERLARLAEVRAKHKQILGDISPDDPDIASAVARQRRAQQLTVADVTRRVADLEQFADLVSAADLAVRKETIVRQLNALDDTHADLLAGIGETIPDADLSQRLANDATALIDQARQAIKHANDAALTLVLPDDEEPSASSA
jgi:hypothetical protein